MTPAEKQKVKETLVATATYFGHSLSNETLGMYIEDLADLPADRVAGALRDLRRDPRTTRCPLPGSIRAKIGDGRPGAEEAWAMIPKDEAGSVVWTEEMAGAFGVARGLLNSGDEVGARMAFREVYTRLVDEARSRRMPTQWSPSLGFDPSGRVAALSRAVDQGLIPEDHAHALIPDLRPKRELTLLPAPAPQTEEEVISAAKVRDLIREVVKDANPKLKAIALRPEVKDMTPEEFSMRREELLRQSKILRSGNSEDA